MLPGSRFGRYEVESTSAAAGWATCIWCAIPIINRKAALKTIRPDTDLDAKQIIEMRQRFYREAQTAGKLTHPNIVTVYDVGEDLGMSYIVMEFVEGKTLTQWMKKQRLSVPQIKHVIYHAGLGLDYAHQNGVFHRDVKPDNIMLSKTGAREGHGLRHRPGRGVEPDEDRKRHGHARLHVAGAGQRREGRRP